MPLIPEESLASSRLVACLCKLRDWCMSLSGAEFKVQSCHRRQPPPSSSSSSPLPPPSLSLQAITGPVLPNFLAARPFGNLEQPRQGHSVWCSKPVQRGRLYVTLCFKHGCMTSLTRSSAVQSCTARSTCPRTPHPSWVQGGGRKIPAT